MWEIGSGETLFLTRITTRLPVVGEELLLCGFRASFMTFPRDTTQFAGQVLISSGNVTARYPLGRDRVMMPWPCLEVSCASWGGMSGGPVYDCHGMLVGILSTSVESGDHAGPSFVSLAWPALGVEFEGGWPGPLFPKPTRLVELDARLCVIDRPDAIRLRGDPVTGSLTTEYRVWE